MKVVRFLEREGVIKFFGMALILAPLINLGLHLFVLKVQNKASWEQVNVLNFLKSGNPFSYFLAFCSVIIGFKMLSGSVKTWRYVLILIGSHLLIQIVNVNNKAWHGPLAWPSFILNAVLFFFIFDQLVWKIKSESKPEIKSEILPKTEEKYVINLKSYRKILFSFGSTKPWGELKTLSSQELSVKSFAHVPASVEHKIIQINFAKDVVIDIRFERKEDEMYYFKPLNMQKNDIARLNTWLKKIAA